MLEEIRLGEMAEKGMVVRAEMCDIVKFLLPGRHVEPRGAGGCSSDSNS